jgi:hypothetical protein
MIKIGFLAASRLPGLVRSREDESWLQTAVGMAGRAGSGPPNTTCLSCIHLDLAASCWSDRGKAAVCLERRRLARGKGRIQEVPVNSASCSRYAQRPDTAAAVAYADERLGERIRIKREQVERLRQAGKRLETDIRELQKLREDPGDDPAWRNFEPAESDG